MFAEVAVGYRTRKCYKLTAALCGVLALGSGPGVVAAAPPNNFTDMSIEEAVTRKLNSDHTLVYDTITVRTTQGIVMLSGTANNLLTRDRAAEDAETVPGVRSVIDTIVVNPVPRTDEQIRRDVAAALLDDPATGSYPINVEVNQGVVLLTGQVGSWAEEQLATQVVKSVRGVKDIQNALWVSVRTRRSDDEIAADVRDRLDSDVWLNARLINIAVINGNVILSGAVGSALERKHAYFDARVAGVRSVDERDLAVKPSLRGPRVGREYPARSDAQIRKSIQYAFLDDPRVSPFSPATTITSGVVVLTGTVDNLKAKRAAEQDAKGTAGVTRVQNDLKVRPPDRPSDNQLAAQIHVALLSDPYLDRSQISVTARNGTILLAGRVQQPFMRDRADDLSSRVKGVIEVKNNIRVK